MTLSEVFDVDLQEVLVQGQVSAKDEGPWRDVPPAGAFPEGGCGGVWHPPIIRPVGKIRVLWAKLRRKEREEKERGARKKEKERKKNWRKEKDKERKEKRRKKERKRRKIERKKKRGYAYVIMQAKIDSVDKCRHLQVSLL